MRSTTLAALFGVAIAGSALAAPPPGANAESDIARWVRTTRDFRGLGCCDLADCRATVARIGENGRYEAWIGRQDYGASAPDRWMPVSPEAMAATSDGPTPDGHVWACYYGGEVRCFFAAGGA